MLIAITIATENFPVSLPSGTGENYSWKKWKWKNNQPFQYSGKGPPGRQPMTKHLFKEKYHSCLESRVWYLKQDHSLPLSCPLSQVETLLQPAAANAARLPLSPDSRSRIPAFHILPSPPVRDLVRGGIPSSTQHPRMQWRLYFRCIPLRIRGCWPCLLQPLGGVHARADKLRGSQAAFPHSPNAGLLKQEAPCMSPPPDPGTMIREKKGL